MIVPPAPIVPGDDSGSILPVAAWPRRQAHRIYDGRDPVRAAGFVIAGVVRILTRWRNLTHCGEIAIMDVRENITWRRVDVIRPFRALTKSVDGFANMGDDVWSYPITGLANSIILPGNRVRL